MELFLSYNHRESTAFVNRVRGWLHTQPAVRTYFSPESPQPGSFMEPLLRELSTCDAFIAFLTGTLGATQLREIDFILERSSGPSGRVPPHEETAPDAFVLFIELSPEIPQEARFLKGRRYRSHSVSPDVVNLAQVLELPADDHRDLNRADVERRVDSEARSCAREIIASLGLLWVDADGIPEGYLWAYEKDVIGMYHRESREARIEKGLPAEWPDVQKQHAETKNPLEPKVLGKYRPEDARVIVDARYRTGAADAIRPDPSLSFPEAGPRERLAFPKRKALRVGILVSGGIAPGINAVIDSIVTRHRQYREAYKRANAGNAYRLSILGYVEGFKAIVTGGPPPIDLRQADTHSHEGGSILGTSRAEELVGHDSAALEKNRLLVRRFVDVDRLDILYIIGGDGSMRAARAISTLAKKTREPEQAWGPLTVVGIPKTMDNDILWAWQSFGFISAVENAKAVVRALHTEARSNPRLGVIQLFGTSSGFVAIHTALGSGVCDAVVIPEVPFTLRELSQHICNRLQERFQPEPGGTSPHGIVLMAEAAVPLDWKEYLDDSRYPTLRLSTDELEALHAFEYQDRQIIGQTPDNLRSAALKLVSGVLLHDIRSIPFAGDYWTRFRVFTNEPRHIIRAVEPSVADVILAQRLGTLAVDGAMAGYLEFMVSQWLTEYVFVPLELVVLGRKKVPQQGIFWKTVVATTGQAEPEEEEFGAS